jgi:hypothetical protein
MVQVNYAFNELFQHLNQLQYGVTEHTHGWIQNLHDTSYRYAFYELLEHLSQL